MSKSKTMPCHIFMKRMSELLVEKELKTFLKGNKITVTKLLGNFLHDFYLELHKPELGDSLLGHFVISCVYSNEETSELVLGTKAVCCKLFTQADMTDDFLRVLTNGFASSINYATKEIADYLGTEVIV